MFDHHVVYSLWCLFRDPSGSDTPHKAAPRMQRLSSPTSGCARTCQAAVLENPSHSTCASCSMPACPLQPEFPPHHTWDLTLCGWVIPTWMSSELFSDWHPIKDSPSTTMWMPFSPGSVCGVPLWATTVPLPVHTDASPDSVWSKLFGVGREGEEEKYLVKRKKIIWSVCL